MANRKISELPAGDALTGEEEIPIVQDGATVRVSMSDVIAMIVDGPVAPPTDGENPTPDDPPPVAPPPAAGDALTWAPPAGYESYQTMTISAAGVCTPSVGAAGVDYLISAPAKITAPVVIRGGRNIVWIGGEIDIDAESASTDVSALMIGGGGSGIAPNQNTNGQTGTVHLEGLWLHGDAIEEGFDIRAHLATIQIQNCLVGPLHYYDDQSHGHPDIIQPTNGFTQLRIDKLTGYTEYQGLFLRVNTEFYPGGGPVYIRRCDITAYDAGIGDGFNGSSKMYSFWSHETATSPTDEYATGIIYAEHCYVSAGITPYDEQDIVTMASTVGGATPPQEDLLPDLYWDPPYTARFRNFTNTGPGKLIAGTPQVTGSHYVTTANVGRTYTSPGYAGSGGGAIILPPPGDTGGIEPDLPPTQPGQVLVVTTPADAYFTTFSTTPDTDRWYSTIAIDTTVVTDAWLICHVKLVDVTPATDLRFCGWAFDWEMGIESSDGSFFGRLRQSDNVTNVIFNSAAGVVATTMADTIGIWIAMKITKATDTMTWYASSQPVETDLDDLVWGAAVGTDTETWDGTLATVTDFAFGQDMGDAADRIRRVAVIVDGVTMVDVDARTGTNGNTTYVDSLGNEFDRSGTASLTVQEAVWSPADVLTAIQWEITSPVTGAQKRYVKVPENCRVTSWEIVGDATGSIVFDIWKDVFANFPPTNADSITGSVQPTVSAAVTGTGSTLTGWTTALTAGDWLELNIDSVSGFTKVVLALNCVET